MSGTSGMPALDRLFGLHGQVAIVTGGTGALGSEMARGLAGAGARVALLGRRKETAEAVAATIEAGGGEALPVAADVTDREQLIAAREQVLGRWGRIDILVNAAGGNQAQATVPDDRTVLDLPLASFLEATGQVLDLNLAGTLRASLIFGAAMAQRTDERSSGGTPGGAAGDGPRGAVVNISSMASQRALTRVPGYSMAKAGVENLTRWLAVELAQKYGAGLRVNAVAPGFFIGDQNRSLLLDPSGALTERGAKIVGHTPAGRFGEAPELVSTVIWLCSPGAGFITGIVVPVDGGFSAFSGV